MGYTKVTISSGHSKVRVRGAVGCGYIENEEAVKVVNRVAEILKQLNVEVDIYHDTRTTQDTNIRAIVKRHNGTLRQIDISVHFNSLNATSTGVEVLYYSNDMQALAGKLSKNIATALGLKNRGAKKRTDLYFLKKTLKPALLIETCFISNPNDMKAYKNNFEKLCQTIAETIAGKTLPKPQPKQETTGAKYRLVSGTFATKADAEACKTKMLTLMKVVYVNQEGTRYRITTGTFATEASAKNMVAKVKKLTGFTFNLKVEGATTVTPKPVVDDNLIMGTPQLTATKLKNYVVKTVGNQTDLAEIAKQYIEIGKKYGIRGDIAFCQACIETGYFRYVGGTAVTPDQHNYCGLGVTKKGVKGCEFATVKDGVTAHIQHLYAYACDKAIPKGETLLDPRFKYVKRGIAPTWNDLSNKWAMNANYGTQIMTLYNKMK